MSPDAVVSSLSADSSSFVPEPEPMDSPPGTLGGCCMGMEVRLMGAPTGMEEGSWPWGALRHAWMRFLPSGWVTRGWSLAVVKVYTRPVSDTTSRRT